MRISVFGLGIIGSVWAKNLAADGHEVVGWNRSPKPEYPFFSGDGGAAAERAEVIAIVVADPEAVRQTLAMIAPCLRAGQVVAQHSTIGTDDTMAAAEQVRATGAAYIDMPFTGSKVAAEQRQSVFYVGDDDGSLARVEAVYRPLSKAIQRIGPVGAATSLKLCMNLLIANSYQALAEAYATATAAGIAPDIFFSTLDLNVAKSGVSDLKKDKLVQGDYRTQFSIKHMHKDLRLVLDLAARLGHRLPQTAQLEQAYAQAQAMGLGDSDFAAMAETLKSRAR